jgi:hypothetical protein
MAKYYFHIKDGTTIFDDVGSELSNLAAVRHAALATVTETLSNMKALVNFWDGEAWTLWVTDQPDGAGKTVLSLRFSATEEAASAPLGLHKLASAVG